MSDNTLGIAVLLGIIVIALLGGFKASKNPSGFFSVPPQTQQISTGNQNQTDLLGQTSENQNYSPYKGIISIQYINRSTDPNYEYATLRMDPNATSTVLISGWTLKSLASGQSVTIPKGTYLIFAGSINTEDPIILTPGDVVYLITGISPNGYSFKSNKCSGYMAQFQTFIPYLYTSCPAPRNEDLSSIPKTVNNDKCFDYIDSMASCRIPTEALPVGLSYECQNFITTKVNYSACITVHKNDSDFYLPEWRVYLKYGSTIWKTEREDIVLLDNNGKLVDEFKY